MLAGGFEDDGGAHHVGVVHGGGVQDGVPVLYITLAVWEIYSINQCNGLMFSWV